MDEKTWTITNDSTAQWALRKIAEARKERDRLVALADEEIKRITAERTMAVDRCDSETAYLQDALRRYFETVEHKETKTKESYKLLGWSLVFKKPAVKMVQDEAALLERLANTPFVETVTKLRWGEYKKTLEVAGDVVVDTTTGEIVPDVRVETTPGEFVVEVDR